MSESTPPGLYLVNATGEMSEVHTGDGQDIDLLREYLDEWDLLEELGVADE